MRQAPAVAAVSLVLLSGCGAVETPTDPGARTYLHYCYSCHAAGIAGAPKVGFRDHWAGRASSGLDYLLARTIAGVSPGMPPRGGCSECPDAELAAAIAYMLRLSGLGDGGPGHGGDGQREEGEP